jgi:hypothetical protein
MTILWDSRRMVLDIQARDLRTPVEWGLTSPGQFRWMIHGPYHRCGSQVYYGGCWIGHADLSITTGRSAWKATSWRQMRAVPWLAVAKRQRWWRERQRQKQFDARFNAAS